MNFKPKHMKNILYTTIAILFIFSSCEKKLDIDLPESEKKIVVNGIVNPDSLMTVRVSKSLNVLDNGEVQYLSDASVKLYKDDVFVESLNNMDSGYFKTTVVPEINSNYNLTVDYAGLNSVNASINLQEPVQIISIDTITEVQINNYGDGFIETSFITHFNIKISDDASKANYYFLSLSALIPIYDIVGEDLIIVGYEEGNMYFESDDPVFRNSDSFTLDNMYGFVFSDEMFNGIEYTLDIDHYLNKLDDQGLNEYGTMYYVKLLTVTKDVYNYVTSYNLNQYTQYDPFAQPVQILTNVENGLGLFSGYTMDVDSVFIEY